MEITISQIHQWLQGQGGSSSGNDLLRQLGDALQLRKTDHPALRMTLCEMAARGQLVLGFGTDQVGSAPIVAMELVTKSPAEEIARLKALLGEAYTTNAELQGTIKANAADVAAADELVTEADTAKVAAEVAVQALQLRCAKLEAQLLQKQGSAPVAQASPRRRSVHDRMLQTARQRAAAAERRVSELLGELSETRRQLGLATRGYNFYTMSCGCMIARGDVSKCRYGGRTHPFYSVAIPGKTYEQGKAILAAVVAEVETLFAGSDIRVVYTNDIIPKRLP